MRAQRRPPRNERVAGAKTDAADPVPQCRRERPRSRADDLHRMTQVVQLVREPDQRALMIAEVEIFDEHGDRIALSGADSKDRRLSRLVCNAASQRSGERASIGSLRHTGTKTREAAIVRRRCDTPRGQTAK